MTANPFRQPLPRRSEVKLRARLSDADERGKDMAGSRGGHPMTVLCSESYLFLGSDLSVPLSWLSVMEPVGPGLRLAWRNPFTQETETVFYCIRMLYWYNRKARDSFLSGLRSLARAAPGVEAAVLNPVCETCASTQVGQWTFVWVRSVLVFQWTRSERRLLCLRHARSRLFFVLGSNVLFSALGVPGMVIMPYVNFRLARAFRDENVLKPGEPLLFLIASLCPAIALVCLLAWSWLSLL